jgi:hypothetical protein
MEPPSGFPLDRANIEAALRRILVNWDSKTWFIIKKL